LPSKAKGRGLADQIKAVGSGFLEKAEILYVGPENQAASCVT
jgi:hypothetical protein